jgi:hypothetical protein
MKKALVVLSLLALTLGALPAVADTLYGGIDIWSTKADGRTFHDFSGAPLPAGFFCEGSAPLTGRVALRGVPIASDEPKILGNTDTIIERLDDAAFNGAGVATTRIRVRGLSLVSVAPIQTSCGAYTVRVNLAGEQPTTTMRIFKEAEDGGRFLAPLALRAKLTFIPVAGHGRALEAIRTVRFDSNPRNQWSLRPTEKLRGVPGLIKIDTDGDNVADTYVAGLSSFAAGVHPDSSKIIADGCHLGPDAVHCPDSIAFTD